MGFEHGQGYDKHVGNAADTAQMQSQHLSAAAWKEMPKAFDDKSNNLNQAMGAEKSPSHLTFDNSIYKSTITDHGGSASGNKPHSENPHAEKPAGAGTTKPAEGHTAVPGKGNTDSSNGTSAPESTSGAGNDTSSKDNPANPANPAEKAKPGDGTGSAAPGDDKVKGNAPTDSVPGNRPSGATDIPQTQGNTTSSDSPTQSSQQPGNTTTPHSK